MIFIGGFAFWKGEEPERVGAGTYLLAWLASMLIQGQWASLTSWIYGVLAIDIVVSLMFAGLAWKTRRAWPYWAAGFALLAVIGHVTTIIQLWSDQKPLVDAYMTALAISSYGIIAAIGVGTFWAWQEREAIKPRE